MFLSGKYEGQTIITVGLQAVTDPAGLAQDRYLMPSEVPAPGSVRIGRRFRSARSLVPGTR